MTAPTTLDGLAADCRAALARSGRSDETDAAVRSLLAALLGEARALVTSRYTKHKHSGAPGDWTPSAGDMLIEVCADGRVVLAVDLVANGMGVRVLGYGEESSDVARSWGTHRNLSQALQEAFPPGATTSLTLALALAQQVTR